MYTTGGFQDFCNAVLGANSQPDSLTSINLLALARKKSVKASDICSNGYDAQNVLIKKQENYEYYLSRPVERPLAVAQL